MIQDLWTLQLLQYVQYSCMHTDIEYIPCTRVALVMLHLKTYLTLCAYMSLHLQACDVQTSQSRSTHVQRPVHAKAYPHTRHHKGRLHSTDCTRTRVHGYLCDAGDRTMTPKPGSPQNASFT